MKNWLILLLILGLGWSNSSAQINLQLNTSDFYQTDIIFHNPAGIALPQQTQATVGNQFLWLGILGDNFNNSYLAFSQPIGAEAAVGMRGVYFKSNLFQEGLVSLILGRKFFNSKISVGLNANLLYYSYNTSKFDLVDLNDPLIAVGHSKNALSLGGGIIFTPFWWLTLGASGDHLNSPDISINNAGVHKRRIYKLGGCLNFCPFMPQVDVRIINGQILSQAGVRSFLNRNLNFFVGYDRMESLQEDLLFETKINLGHIGMSYQFQYPLTELAAFTLGSHRVALNFSSGGFFNIPRKSNIRIFKPENKEQVQQSPVKIVGDIHNDLGITSIKILVNNELVNKIPSVNGVLKDVHLSEFIHLREGENEIEIIASTAKVTNSKKLKISYLIPQKPKIVVLSAKDCEVKSYLYSLRCFIENVKNPNDVTLIVNGQNESINELNVQEQVQNGFVIRKDLNLVKGENKIEIVANNTVDSASKLFTLLNNREEALPGIQPYQKSWAFIIGIDQYQDPDIVNLKKAVSDAQQIETTLRQNFRFDHVITLYNEAATRDKITTILEDQFAKASEKDAIMFFFAGHSVTVQTQFGDLGYILPFDARQGATSTWLSMDDIRRSALKANAVHVLYIMDCCYGGQLIAPTNLRSLNMKMNQKRVLEMARKRSRIVLTAGGQGEQDVDGIFVPRFLEGLNGRADLNHDAYITSLELYNYVFDKVTNDAILKGWIQNPQYGKLPSDQEGVFIFRRK